MNKEKLRVAVIGVGHLGEYHVQKYKDIPDVELVGVVDINQDRVSEISNRYHTRPFGHHEEILGMVDAVSLAVPTETHFQVARDVLSKGVHILIEKPITYNLDHADSLLDLAREKALVLQVGLVERFNPAVVKMASLLNRPTFIEAHRMNLFTARGIDVDVVLDLMIHDLDIILHMVQAEVKEVHAVGMSVITDKTDVANARLIFENGIVANLTASRVSINTLRTIQVFQPDAHISADCHKRTISVVRLNGKAEGLKSPLQFIPEREEFSNSDPLADEIVSFVRVVRNGSDPVVSGQDGRRALNVALGIIDQIEGGNKYFKSIS
ncbi:MAG: Gfo/Idh/MocA family oxidoreductase [Desulfatiglans sp.]|nr:Gfo/Idh/MocA family oxidoreductase [Thermodesulfobacteriota bacterium]MEE4351612.1 Gfo/Idh/MocA family oxidoreductase [Desulfatiglans sp.]